MKNINNKGFTLIELLAVITIIGILMVVAIPAVTRTIENSRKDTFVNTAKTYGNSARSLWATEGLSCYTNEGTMYTSSAVPDGTYYIKISTDERDDAPQLLESGGKSSWGSRDVKGYVQVDVKTQTGTIGDSNADGKINVVDIVKCKAVFNSAVPEPFEKKLCDVNEDGGINADDLNIIKEYILYERPTENTYRVGEIITARTENFYVVVSDGIHGINISEDGSIKSADELTTSEQIVRGDLQMSGATYISSLPTGNICEES